MGSESIQEKTGRGSAAEILHIKYKVETNGSSKQVELPFLMGVMAPLSGEQVQATPLKARDFVDIDRNNFNEVMRGLGCEEKREDKMGPRLVLDLDEPDLKRVELRFPNMDAFTPQGIIDQVDHLKRLYTLREKLHGLLNKVGGQDDLLGQLQKIIADASAAPAGGKEERHA